MNATSANKEYKIRYELKLRVIEKETLKTNY
jgi:hypothetical protein